MKKYGVKLLAMLLALVFPFAAYFTWNQNTPAQFTDSIMGTVLYKLQLLRQTPGPRLILAGGSSSPYGTNCKYLAKELGMASINVGATAYFGVDFYISMISQNMREGDIIVIAPEFSMLCGAISYETVWMAVENQPEVWEVVPTSYWPEMIKYYYDYAQSKRARMESGGPNNTYNEHFGPLGDVTLLRESLLESGYNTEDPIALGPQLVSPAVIRSLNNFFHEAQKAGVQVFFAFAPVNILALTTQPEEWQALEDFLREQLAAPMLGSQRQAVMEAECFYDSNNHLTTQGAQIYSEQMARNLQKQLSLQQ